MAESSDLIYEVAPARVGEPPHPAAILLHGRGANERDLLSLATQVDPRLTVVAPRAPYPLGPDAYHWYDLEAAIQGRPSSQTLERAVALVMRLVDRVETDHGLDGKKLFVGGFSMGAAVAGAAILFHPQRFGGAALLSGSLPLHSELPNREGLLTALPVFQAHGLYDGVIPVQYARISRDFLQSVGADLTYREYPIGHEVGAEELNDLVSWQASVLDRSGS